MRSTLVPERLVAGGDALARDEDGRVVFVAGALPGERVEVEVWEQRRDFGRGRTVRVVGPSGDRVDPPCVHRRAGCGGCDWMHLDPAAQLHAKTEIVRESLVRVGRFDAGEVGELVVDGGRVPPSSYRTTVRVVGGDARRPGFRRERSDELVAVDSCLVAHPRLSSLLGSVEIGPGVELTLRTSVATGETTAAWSPRDRRAVVGLPADVRTGRRASLREIVAGRELRVTATAFFQSGPAAAELLVGAVARAVSDVAAEARRAVDAYGGGGLFASTVLADLDEVIVLESSAVACDDARHNLRDRQAVVVEGDAGRWRAEQGAIDLVVADPARAGLGRRGVEALTSAAPAPIVLVSCDPVSMARDAALLRERGYRPESLEVLDLFPQTHHVETVTRFAAATS